MKKTKTPPPIKDADEIINQFISTCDIVHTSTVFVKLCLANFQLRRKEKDIPQDAPWSVNPDEEKTMKAIQAINTMLYEIERTMKVEV